ncbi:MAG: ArnT family glycosyltransferase [Elusimicrobiota bacterium]
MAYKKKNIKDSKKPQTIFGISREIIFVIAAAWIYIVSAAFMRDRNVMWGISHLFELQGTFNLLNFLSLCLSYVVSIIFFAGTVIGIHLIGNLLLSAFRVNFNSDEEKTLMSIAAGAGVLSLSMFAFALLGLLYPFFMYVLWAVGVIFGFKKARNSINSFSFKEIKLTAGTKIILFILFVALLFNFIMAFTPEIFYDTLNYHLGVPNIYKQFGQYVELPYKHHASFPLVPQMTFLFTIMIDSTAAAKLLNLAFAIFTALAVYIFSRDRLDSAKTGFYAAVIYLLIPNVLFRSWTVTTDTMLTFLTFLSLWGIINFIIKKEKRWLILSAVFGGFVMGSKLTGIFFVTSIFILIVAFGVYTLINKFKLAVLWGVIMITVFSPWLIRNTIETGNPVHPQFENFFTTEYPYNIVLEEKGQEHKDRITHFTRVEKLKNIISMLWDIPVQGGKFDTPYDSPDYYMTGALFLIFIPLLLLFKGKREETKVIKYLLVFSAASYFFWGIQSEKVKYFAPAFPSLALLAAAGADRMAKAGQIGSIVASGVLGFHLMVNFLTMSFVAQNVYIPFSLVTGMVSRDEYLSDTRQMYPNPSYNSFKYAHDNLSNDVKILVSCEAKTYHLKRPHISFAPSMREPLMIYTSYEEINSGRDLYEFLDEKNYSHIIFNAPEAVRTSSYGYLDLIKEEEVLVQQEFFNEHLNMLYKDNNSFLYEIVESSDEPVYNPVLDVLNHYHQQASESMLENIERGVDGAQKEEFLEKITERADIMLEINNSNAQAHYFNSYSYYLLGNAEKAVYHASNAARLNGAYEQLYQKIKNAIEER